MDGIVIGDFYLTLADILGCFIVGCILFFLLYLFGRKFRKQLKFFLYEGKSKVFLLRIVVVLALNYPFFLIKNIAQTEANGHLDPFAGYLTALFLLCLVVYMLWNSIKGFRIIKWRPLFSVLFIQILLTSVIWAYWYLSIDCSVCNSDV